MSVTELWLIRHGESVANVAAAAADRAGEDVIRVEHRDADVPLSDLGTEQAAALGDGLADRGVDGVPLAVWASPYHRAQETIRIALSRAASDTPVRVDERLRDRELGVLDLLTRQGVRNRYPDEEARRRWLGKYYHRPSGGESWIDVRLRLRSLMHDVDRLGRADSTQDDPARLVVAAHDAVVMLLVANCLDWDEPTLLEFAREHTVANASLTRLSRDDLGAPWRLDEFSAVDHLDERGTPITEHQGEKPTSERDRSAADAH